MHLSAAVAALPVTSGLQARWAADSLALADAATVTSLADTSGNSRTITGSSPVFVANGSPTGKPAIRFDGSASSHGLGPSSSILRRTVIAVVSWRGGGSNFPGSYPAIMGEASDSDHAMRGEATLPQIRNNGAIYVNGVTTGVFPLDASLNVVVEVFSSDATGAVLMGAQAAGATWNGDIAELLVYDTALSDANRQLVEAFLKTKYGTP